MDEMKVIINGVEYSENQFKRDITRMFDKYRYVDSEHMGEDGCKDVVCENCPLDGCCGARRHNMFERIRIVYNWAKDYPVVTNRDKMIETFGGAYFNLIINYISDRSLEDYDTWLNEEYKEPKGKK